MKPSPNSGCVREHRAGRSRRRRSAPRRAAPGLEARADHGLEEVEPREDDDPDQRRARRRAGRAGRERAAAGGTGRARTAGRPPRPSRPLRESVASSTISRKASTTASCRRSRCPRGEPQVDRQQDEQRDDQHDPEVVRVAGERIRPVDALALDRAVDVDRARPAGQRREHGVVEVPPALRGDELQHAVGGVERRALP